MFVRDSAPQVPTRNEAEPAFASEARRLNEPRDPTRIAVVTGYGGPGPQGLTNAEAYENTRAGVQRFEPIRYFDARSFPGGRAFHVPEEMREAERNYLSREEREYGRATRYAILATRMALAQSGHSELSEFETPVLIGTTTNDLEAMAREIERAPGVLNGNASEKLQKSTMQRTAFHLPAAAVANHLGLKGEVAALSTACASPGNLLGVALSKIRSGEANTVLVGGTEAPINTFVMNMFTQHGLVTKDDRVWNMDERSSGTGLSEGAVVFVVESLQRARERGARPLFEIEGIGLGQDSMLHPDRKGELRAQTMHRALGANGAPDAVVMHAPGFAPMEAIEARAERAYFGEAMPPHTVQKGCIGGGGAYHIGESIRLAAMMLERQEILPVINCERPARYARGLNLVTGAPRDATLQRIAINFAGLLGSTGTIVLRRVEEE